MTTDSRRTEGFSPLTVWVKMDDYRAGYDAAQLGSTNASSCPSERDRVSWTMGYCAWLDRLDSAKGATINVSTQPWLMRKD